MKTKEKLSATQILMIVQEKVYIITGFFTVIALIAWVATTIMVFSTGAFSSDIEFLFLFKPVIVVIAIAVAFCLIGLMLQIPITIIDRTEKTEEII